MFNLTAEQMNALSDHPVINYFGIEAFARAMMAYILYVDPTLEDADNVTAAIISIAMNDHDLLFQMIEDNLQ